MRISDWSSDVCSSDLNLQVISSLINFHARGARSAEVVTAYAPTQRRVDALAVVHRNHFAGMEENRGPRPRSVIGKLSLNYRDTAPTEAASRGKAGKSEGVGQGREGRVGSGRRPTYQKQK